MVERDAPLWPAHLDVDAEWERLTGCHLEGMSEVGFGAEPPTRPLSAELVASALSARPGPDAIGLLSAVDPTELDPGERIDWATAWDRQASYVAARRLAAIAHVAEHTAPADRHLSGPEVAEAELAPALNVSRGTVGNDMSLAFALAGKLAPTGRLLETGQLSVRHVHALVDELGGAAPDVAAAVQAEVLARAAAGLTPARLRRLTRRTLLRVDAAAVAERRAAHVRDRAVTFTGLGDDMAELRWTSTVDEIATAKAVLDRLAARKAAPDDDRSADARRSDALFGTILAAWDDPDLPDLPGRRGHKADITVSYETLTGLADHPGNVPGFGPVTAELARRMTTSANLRFLIYNPDTGRLLRYDPGTWTPIHPAETDIGADGVTGAAAAATPAATGGIRLQPGTWRPTASLRRYLDARDPHCTAPGCDIRITDHDHVIPFHDGGPTTDTNANPECERDHLLKTHAGWTVTIDPDGTRRWTTRAGKTYTEPPHDHRPDR